MMDESSEFYQCYNPSSGPKSKLNVKMKQSIMKVFDTAAYFFEETEDLPSVDGILKLVPTAVTLVACTATAGCENRFTRLTVS